MDLEGTTADLVIREFLAVVLAGFGNELLPLTSDHGEEPCPKALLPVINRPIIDYVLTWLEQSGIKDVLLICPAIHRPAIYHHIHSDASSAMHIDLQTYDESQESSVGTCDILRHFSSRIKEDFVLVPCDFVPPPSLPLSLLLNKFRVDAVSDGAIATTCWFEAQKSVKDAFPEEWRTHIPSTSIVWDEPSGTLLYVDTPDDQERNAEEFVLRMSLLSQYPRTKLSSNFQDSHVYVCRRSVLDALHEKRHVDSFREEFLPWLCKVQYQRTRRQKYARVLNPIVNTSSQAPALKHSTTLSKQNKHADHVSPFVGLSTKDNTVSVPTSPTDSDDDHNVPNSFRVGVVIHRAKAGFATRVHTIPNFLEINRRLLSNVTYSLPTDPKNRSLIDQKAQISTDTIIGDSTQISERAVIKKSVIGRHCVIGRMAKVVGCVLLDHCVVEEGAKLEGCILGKNTKVGSKAEVVRCVTQAGYEISAGENVKGEKLDMSDWTAALDESEEDDDDDDDDDDDEDGNGDGDEDEDEDEEDSDE